MPDSIRIARTKEIILTFLYDTKLVAAFGRPLLKIYHHIILRNYRNTTISNNETTEIQLCDVHKEETNHRTLVSQPRLNAAALELHYHKNMSIINGDQQCSCLSETSHIGNGI
ncbi:hypothetical protein L2E82_47772 [Cichorium intybus]|uniref:Uncharacterized protein n=1 Tax=Cichorium intybus TaxID=13427 RepID=A0ACB8YWM9_CICIN|nr:hypothetical protein L2E82_47772 [Cichorium intybus]